MKIIKADIASKKKRERRYNEFRRLKYSGELEIWFGPKQIGMSIHHLKPRYYHGGNSKENLTYILDVRHERITNYIMRQEGNDYVVLPWLSGNPTDQEYIDEMGDCYLNEMTRDPRTPPECMEFLKQWQNER